MAVRLSRLTEVLASILQQNSLKLVIISLFTYVCTNSEFQCLIIQFPSFSPKLLILSKAIHNCKHQESSSLDSIPCFQFPRSSYHPQFSMQFQFCQDSLLAVQLPGVCLISGENRSDENTYEYHISAAYLLCINLTFYGLSV